MSRTTEHEKRYNTRHTTCATTESLRAGGVFDCRANVFGARPARPPRSRDPGGWGQKNARRALGGLLAASVRGFLTAAGLFVAIVGGVLSSTK